MDFLNESAPVAETSPLEVEQLPPPEQTPAPGQPPVDPPGRARLQQLHSYLVHEGTDVPQEYQTFEQKLLEKPERLHQLHDYLVKEKTDVPAQYGVFEEKMTEGLPGYVKKKALFAPAGGAAGTGSATAGEATNLTLPAGDREFVSVLPAAGDPSTEPAAGGPPQPGAQVDSATPTPLDPAPGEPTTFVAPPVPTPEQLAYLQQLPGGARPELAMGAGGERLFRRYGDLPELADGSERVRLPDDYQGPEAPGTYQIPGSTEPQARYFDRPLSKEVAGEGEQGLGMAAARNFNNLVADGFKGLATGLDDASRLISNATGLARGGAFAEVAQAVEGTKKPVAPYYQSHELLAHPNAKNLLMATSDVAGMAVPLVAQALAPEAGAGRVLAQALGTGAGLMFDGQLIQGAHDRAVQAGMTPDQAAVYTLLDSGLSLATFKLGGAALGKVGEALTPAGVKSEVMREAYRLLAGREGQQLTREQLKGVLAQATAAATPRLLKLAAEGGKLGTLFGVNEAKTLLTEAAARRTIGAKFTQPTLGEAVQRVVGATAEGAIIGAATGAATPSRARTLPLGTTPGGRSLAVELSPQGEPVRYLDEQGAPVDFGKAGPPPAVVRATEAAQAANPAPVTPDDLLTHQRVPVYKYRGTDQLYADYDQQGQATRLYNEQGQPFALDDAQVRAAVEKKWPGASGEAGAGPGSSTASPSAAGPSAPQVVEAFPTASEAPAPAVSASPTELRPTSEAGPAPASAAPAYGTPAQNRAAGRFEKDGQVFERAAPLGERVARGNQTTAEFASGVQQPVQYAVMEAADVQPSHLNGSQNLRHFLPEAQPKNRSAAFDPASQKAIADIAASPDLARLGEAPNAYSGAPIVNQRGEALQGNGRAAGIRAHYAQGGESYKQGVVAAAERVGIPASETARFREPVLVRVADVSDQRARELGNYTAADTESGGKRRLNVRQASGKLDEQGRADLARLATPQGDATLTETLRANAPELVRVLRKAGAINETQLQTLVKADGTLTPEGVEDLASLYRHQLFADGDPNLPELFAELPAAAQGGLDRASSALLGLPEASSIVPEVQQAIGGVRELRASGTDFATWAGQADMFRGGVAPRERYSPLTLRLIELLTTEKRPTVIARYFQEYARAVRGEADSLFGATPPKSRAEASQQVFGVADERPVGVPAVDSTTQPVSSDERPSPDPRNPGAAESPPRPDAADERPAAPEPRPAPGPPAAADDTARPRVDAGDTEPRPAAGVTTTEAGPVTVKVGHTAYVVGQDAAGKPTVTNQLTKEALRPKHPHYQAALYLARDARQPARAPLAAGALVYVEAAPFRNRAEAETWARGNIQGTQVTNSATGEQITISRAGIDKALSGKAFDKSNDAAAHLAAVQVLPELLQSAEPRGELEADKHGDHNLAGVQRYGAQLRVGDQQYPVKITVKVAKREGSRFYTHEIEKVELLAERPTEGEGLQSGSGQADPITTSTSTSETKITSAPDQTLPTGAGLESPTKTRPGLPTQPAPALRSLHNALERAMATGDATEANRIATQAQQVADTEARRLTESGRPSVAFRLLAEHAPSVLVHQAEQEVATQRTEAEAKLAEQATAETAQLKKEKAQALDHALATPAVRAVREQVAGKTPPTTAEQLAAVRAERARLLDELRQGGKSTGQAYSSLVPITPEMARATELHLRILRTYVKEGVVHVRDLMARWKRDAGPLVAGIDDEELAKLATTALADHRVAVRQGVAELGTTLDKLARDYTTDAGQVGATLAERFVAGAGLAPAEAQRYAEAIRQEFDRRIEAARQRGLDQLARRAAADSAAKPTRADLEQTRQLFALAPTDDMAILDHLRRTTALPTLSVDEVAHLRALAQAVNAAPAGFQKDAAVGKLLHAMAQRKAINWLEVGHAMWFSNVLSNYKTHGLNLFQNSLQTGSELLVHTTHALVSGKGRYAAASGRGLAEGLVRGAREAVSVLTTGREVNHDSSKYEEPGLLEYRRFAGGAANPVNYLKFVGRALRAGDVLFSTGLKEMRAHELAVKEALAQGQAGEPGAAVWARVNEHLYRTSERLAAAKAQATAEGLSGNDHARRVYELAEQSRPVKLTEEAREYATRSVYNGDVKGTLGWATKAVEYATNGIAMAGFKPAKYVVPFTRVLANVANAALDYTPVGAARAGISLAREKTGRGSGGYLFGGKPTSELQRQLTGEEREHLAIKAVFGAASAVAAYALSHNKDEHGNPALEISGNGTGNPAKDAQLRAEGWQPYSVRVRGTTTWYSYAGLPHGLMLAVVGNLNDGEKYRDEHIHTSDEALEAVALNSFRALQLAKDMTALKGTADFLAAISSQNLDQVKRWAQRQAVGTVKGYVPWSALLTQLVKDGEQLAGQPRKQARTFTQALVQDVPVARNSLHDALDVLGDPLPVDTDRLVSEAPDRDAPTRAVWDWLEKNRLFVPVPNRNSGGAMVLRAHNGEETPMTDDEHFAFMQHRGRLLKASLQQQLPELQKLTPTEAKKVLKQQVQRATRAAKQQVFTGR